MFDARSREIANEALEGAFVRVLVPPTSEITYVAGSRMSAAHPLSMARTLLSRRIGNRIARLCFFSSSIAVSTSFSTPMALST